MYGWFFPQQLYEVFVVRGSAVDIQNIDCILKLADKYLEFHGLFFPVGKSLQRFLGIVDIHELYLLVTEMLRVMILCTTSASNLYFFPVIGKANIAFNTVLIDCSGLVRSS